MQLPAESATGLLREWMASGQQVGIQFFGTRGMLASLVRITNVDAGRISFVSESTGISFRLKEATYALESLPMWPQWPYPPIVNVKGLKVWYPSAEFLFISEASPRLGFGTLPKLGGPELQ